MFTLKIENGNGEIFELTHDTRNYAITGVQGLTPPSTVVNTSTGGMLDGTFYNSSRVNQRNIVITIDLRGDIETNRQRIYKMFPRKTPCTIYFANANRDVKIVGYVETLEADLFVMRETVQISIICPRPYFEDLNALYTELSKITRMFEFPFSISTPIPFSEIVDYPVCTITNDGGVESGFIMTVKISDDVSNLKIYNSTTQKFIGFDYSFTANDEITINTKSGEMGVYLVRDGVKTNLLNFLANGAEWLKLTLGDNNFTYSCDGDSEGIEITFETVNYYGGV